jgi:hypothetical protein
VPWRRAGIDVGAGGSAVLDITMRPQPVTQAPSDPAPSLPRPPAPSEPRPTEASPPHRLLNEIDDFLDQLDVGHIAFNAPERMLVGETAEMRLLLSPVLNVDELVDRLRDLRGELQGAEIRVAPRMEALISGQNFEITAITPATQAVSRGEPTEWRWEVSPKSPGAHRLYLVLNAHIIDSTRTLRTFDRTIQVNVTVGQQLAGFVRGNWQWLWTTALVPLAGWLWQRRRRASHAASRRYATRE